MAAPSLVIQDVPLMSQHGNHFLESRKCLINGQCCLCIGWLIHIYSYLTPGSDGTIGIPPHQANNAHAVFSTESNCQSFLQMTHA